MVYRFQTRHFVWWISYDLRNRRWNLAFGDDPNDEVWGNYYNPEQAAADVYSQATGNDDWDDLPEEEIPQDIECIQSWEVYNSR